MNGAIRRARSLGRLIVKPLNRKDTEMVNKGLKRQILNHPATRKIYEAVRDAYRKAHARRKCARLRRYGCEILSKVEGALKDSGMAYFIDYGTLLGFAREHDFIRHDDDIDYTVLAETGTLKDVYERISRLPGFAFSHAFEFRGQITELTYTYRGIDVDFFFAYPHGREGRHFTPFYQRFSEGVAYPDATSWSAYGQDRLVSGNMIRRDFLSLTVSVPENYEHVLRESYGTWRVPVVGWNGKAKDYGQIPIVRLHDLSREVGEQRVREIGDRVDASRFEDLT